MKEKDYKGRVFAQETVGIRMDDGGWKVTVTMTEKVTLNNGIERVETIEAMAMDSTFNDAHRVALQSSMAELQDLVYARGFESLIEGRDYQRSLEAANGGSKNNSTTITQ